MVKNLWKQKFNEIHQELKGIYSKNNDKAKKLLIELKFKIHLFLFFRISISVENFDRYNFENINKCLKTSSELQTKIINDFMMENLKRFRKEMDEFREKMKDIRSDAKVFSLFYEKKVV